MSVQLAALLRGLVAQSSAADNATATATVAAIEGVTHLVLGVEAHYDVSVSAIRDIVLTVDGAATTYRWDFTNGPFIYNLPVALSGDPNEAVTCTLEASGAGSTNGYVSVYYAEN